MTDETTKQLLDLVHNLIGAHDGPTVIIEGVVVVAEIIAEDGQPALFAASTPMAPYRASSLLRAQLLMLDHATVHGSDTHWTSDDE